ncbi:MAG: TonB-dependent receptor [Pseudomonadota bacterium]|nr:MAG: TonB-dependent receptor [Pseudomonadota bacterium]
MLPVAAVGRVALLASLYAASLPVYAEPDPTVLEPVVVSATRSTQHGNPTGSSITIITRADIKASGLTRLPDILRTVAGVQVSDLYGDGSRVNVGIRGFGDTAGSNVLVLVDGRRLNNPDIAPPELTATALRNVERIEIIQGSAGVLYGDQATGGVVNIITRIPDRTTSAVAATAGSYDTQQLTAQLAGEAGRHTRYRVLAEGRESDNYRENNEVKYGNLLGRVDREWRSGTAFLELQHVREDLNLPGGLFRPQYDADRRAARFPTDFSDTRTNVQRLGLRQGIASDWVIEGELANRSADIDGQLTSSPFTQERRVTELTPRLVGRVRTATGEVNITTGADLSQSDYSITSPFGVTENDQHAESLYAQAALPVSPRSTVTVGARHARIANNLRDSFTYPSGIELDDDVTVGSLGWSTQVDQTLRVFARADQNYRFPKVDELAQTLGGVIGLKTQTGVSYEAGTQWQRGEHLWKVLIYRLDLENEIDYDTVAFANVNFDPTRRDGLLLEGRWRAAQYLSLRGQYAYVDASFRSGPFAGNRVPLVSTNAAWLAADMQLTAKWYFILETRYAGERIVGGDVANSLEKLDGYTIGNLALGYRRPRLSATFRVNNLTNREFSDYAAASFNPATFTNETAFYAAPTRNYMLTVECQF